VAMRTSGTLSYLLADALGSSTVALTSSGSTQAVQLFAPYGSIRYSQGSMPTTYNFTGQRLDSQTGLLYYGFRYCDPVSGRFVRADTTQTNAEGMDPYAYVGENPETETDPTGQYYTDGSPYDRGYLEPDANGDGGYYLLVYTPSNAAAPSLNDEWVNYRHYNRQRQADAVGGWAANGRPVIQCIFDCNSNPGLLAGAIVLNPEAEAACVAAPEACVAAGLTLLAALLIIEALKHPVPPTGGPTIAQARSHQNDLPMAGKATGPYIYIPPKSARGNPANAWDKVKNGFRDASGNIWVWDRLHKDHWDVQHPDGSYDNVWPDGRPGQQH
jgi:RHS repeat-associated protein